MMKTKWKVVSDNPSYLVSTGGKIKSVLTGKVIRQYINEKGYKRVQLHRNGVKKWYRVHILVAKAHVENDDPENKKEVNHIFGKKFDNRSSQLEWTTRQQNLLHAKENGFTAGRVKREKQNKKTTKR